MNAFEILKTVVGLMPMVIQLIQAVESAMPQGGNGATKLQLVLDTLKAGYSAAGQAVSTFEPLVPVFTTLISSFVAVFNKTGVFSTTKTV